MGRRMIEKLREREAQMDQAHPVEVTEDDTLSRFLCAVSTSCICSSKSRQIWLS